MAALSIADEVERCLPYFVRLCVNDLVATGDPLRECAVSVAHSMIGRIPVASDPALRNHFEATLRELVDLMSVVTQRLPPDMLRDYVNRTSEAEVAGTIERHLIKALAAANA